ncbi:MAG: GNVR domain-containing protein [bacterium]|nr:GNVR domain-containing protein [bacterium]
MPPEEPTLLDEEPTLLDFARAIRRRLRLVTVCVALAAAAAATVTLIMPREYRAEALIYVPGQSSALGGFLRQADVSIAIPDLSLRSPDYVVAVLKSRVLAEAVVKDVDLPYPPRPRRAAAQAPGAPDERIGILQKMTTVRERRGLVTIAIDAPDPALAAKAANAYVRLLDRYVQKRSTVKRQFIETQLEEARHELRSAEEAYRRFQNREGVVALDVELQEAVKALGALESEAGKTEAALAENVRMTEESGSLVEIAALQTQHAGLRGRQEELRRLIARMRSRLDAVPAQALQAARLRRNVELLTRRYALLLEQYQLTRIAEQQEETIFQVIDPAVPPDRLARPRPLLNLALGLALGLLAGVAAALVLESQQYRPGGGGEPTSAAG